MLYSKSPHQKIRILKKCNDTEEGEPVWSILTKRNSWNSVSEYIKKITSYTGSLIWLKFDAVHLMIEDGSYWLIRIWLILLIGWIVHHISPRTFCCLAFFTSLTLFMFNIFMSFGWNRCKVDPSVLSDNLWGRITWLLD